MNGSKNIRDTAVDFVFVSCFSKHDHDPCMNKFSYHLGAEQISCEHNIDIYAVCFK